ncbi:UNVERIFIED_CONTAM: hypothetical protein Sradi_0696600 [Sesamum radiatum]|uniref:Calcineurin-like phosphoesterase domain-containing protein n=1 Tax=Sesamum radiatum TaxID=300843 RepID=A0AAW2VSB2_SESRA
MLNLTLFLCIVWALSLLYGEWFAYLVPSLWTCSWPHHRRPSSSSLDGVDYPSKWRSPAVLGGVCLLGENPQNHLLWSSLSSIRGRAFLSSVLPLKPDVVLFLGDYFDGVPYCRMKIIDLFTNRWQESLGRLRHIFNLNMLQKSSNTKVYYLSGNHDIGYSAFNSRKLEIVKRYEREFGVRNFKVTLGNVDFIAIDAQTLDDIHSTPRVLLTHIPLYRPDGTPCGPHRSASIINQSLVLSAHDHDQCTVTHMSKNGQVIEQTVGTISWQQGNLYPSFMLLSASNSTLLDGSSPENAASSQLCFLPMQTHIYLWYLSLFGMTLVIVLLWPANEVLILRKLGELMGCIRSLYNSFSNRVKEKNEDENCEYEEIWDAEGTMHLIKKKKKVSSVVLNERSSVER